MSAAKKIKKRQLIIEAVAVQEIYKKRECREFAGYAADRLDTLPEGERARILGVFTVIGELSDVNDKRRAFHADQAAVSFLRDALINWREDRRQSDVG